MATGAKMLLYIVLALSSDGPLELISRGLYDISLLDFGLKLQIVNIYGHVTTVDEHQHSNLCVKQEEKLVKKAGQIMIHSV